MTKEKKIQRNSPPKHRNRQKYGTNRRFSSLYRGKNQAAVDIFFGKARFFKFT